MSWKLRGWHCHGCGLNDVSFPHSCPRGKGDLRRYAVCETCGYTRDVSGPPGVPAPSLSATLGATHYCTPGRFGLPGVWRAPGGTPPATRPAAPAAAPPTVAALRCAQDAPEHIQKRYPRYAAGGGIWCSLPKGHAGEHRGTPVGAVIRWPAEAVPTS